ncbi:hypothetical protein LJC45_05380 [Alistipes sp. OttesenSCG-928-B03]|nr:hypothetical protein [Alistipes sp. OttesenSCG-928-B03]
MGVEAELTHADEAIKNLRDGSYTVISHGKAETKVKPSKISFKAVAILGLEINIDLQKLIEGLNQIFNE